MTSIRLAISMGAIALTALVSSASAGYHLAHRIPVGGSGGWDCLEVDEDRN